MYIKNINIKEEWLENIKKRESPTFYRLCLSIEEKVKAKEIPYQSLMIKKYLVRKSGIYYLNIPSSVPYGHAGQSPAGKIL